MPHLSVPECNEGSWARAQDWLQEPGDEARARRPFAGMLCRPALDCVWECLDVLAACLDWADKLDDPAEVHALPV